MLRTISFIDEMGSHLPDGTVVKLFHDGDDVYSAAPIETLTISGGKIQTPNVTPGYYYQAVVNGLAFGFKVEIEAPLPISQVVTSTVTPVANNISVISSLPTTGYEGQLVVCNTAGTFSLYTFNQGVWKQIGSGPVPNYSDAATLSGKANGTGNFSGAGLTWGEEAFWYAGGDNQGNPKILTNWDKSNSYLDITLPPVPAGYDYWKQEFDIYLNATMAASGILTEMSLGFPNSADRIDGSSVTTGAFYPGKAENVDMTGRFVVYWQPKITTTSLSFNCNNINWAQNIYAQFMTTLTPCKLMTGQGSIQNGVWTAPA